MSEVLDPFRGPIGMDENSTESSHLIVERQLLEAKLRADTSHKYRQKVNGKLLEAETFAVVWQRSGQELRRVLEGLAPNLGTNRIFKQKLLNLLEMAEENTQLGEKAIIALKMSERYTTQSETCIQQAQLVLEEMMDSLAIFINPERTNIDSNNALAEQTIETESNQALIFSGQAKEALLALTTLKAELNEMQKKIGHNP